MGAIQSEVYTLTVIAQGNQWWIETFVVARAAIANQAVRDTTHTLGRSGAFLAGGATLDSNIAAADSTGILLSMRKAGGAALVVGDEMITFETRVGNDSGSSSTVGEFAWVLLRKRT